MPDDNQKILLQQMLRWLPILNSTDPQAREAAVDAIRGLAFALLVTMPAGGRA